MQANWCAAMFSIALACAVPLFGCGGDKSTDLTVIIGEVFPPGPAAVMPELRRAYEAQDIVEYRKLFDPGAFFFEFSARDGFQDPTLPPGLDFAIDQASTEHLFADSTVDRIALRFGIGEPVPATDVDQLPGGPEGVTKIELVDVHVEVHSTDGDGESIEYVIERDRADFFLRAFPDEQVAGRVVWKIVHWRDRPVGAALAPENTSWGLLKARFL